ncbi:unnamed protein product [Brachionus calyciflorus]|uniref:Uncharacterized protein n=1 Tax=Brachionus calyciflorus TaxID=104777 RepID=A0A814C9U3_9BILA|nr:unnamed protein product [Brachionus calyciflorus]
MASTNSIINDFSDTSHRESLIYSDQNQFEKNCSDRIVKNKIFVRNLEWSTHENLLKHFFSSYGPIKKCKILRDLETNRSKGCGIVEFEDEKGPENVLSANKEDLNLGGRRLFVDSYKKPIESKNKKKFHERPREESFSTKRDELEIKHESDFSISLIEKLPYNVLCKIFSYLSIRDLCIVEQVCKRWYEIARLSWQQKNRLVLTNKNIFENYSSRKDNQYGFCVRPDFGRKAIFQILSKNLKNLKYFDIAEYHSKFGIQIGEILKMLAETCPNLIGLNLANLSASNKSFTPLVKNCQNLKFIDISNCRRLSDASISKIFQHCPQLEQFNFSNCREIVGSCFERINFNNLYIKNVCLDDCENIEDEFLVLLLNRCKNIKTLSLNRSRPYSPNSILNIINEMPNLESLYISFLGFDSLKNYDFKSIKFENLENLKVLDISKSGCNNTLLTTILEKLKNLRILKIDDCTSLTSDPFCSLKIQAPLEELNLNFNRNITDQCLYSLTKFSKTLKVLKLKGCARFTNQAIISMIGKMEKLTDLDLSLTYADNSVLETVLWYKDRKFHINCNDTNIDTNKFTFDHPSTIKKLRDRDSPLFEFENLTFESLSTPIRKTGDERSWGDSGMIYIGPPLDSDEGEFDFDFDDGNDEGNDRDNDLDEFLEDENEMYQEI